MWSCPANGRLKQVVDAVALSIARRGYVLETGRARLEDKAVRLLTERGGQARVPAGA